LSFHVCLLCILVSLDGVCGVVFKIRNKDEVHRSEWNKDVEGKIIENLEGKEILAQIKKMKEEEEEEKEEEEKEEESEISEKENVEQTLKKKKNEEKLEQSKSKKTSTKKKRKRVAPKSTDQQSVHQGK
jgi:hypothetical protein